MMSGNPRVLIVGAGISGLATSLAAARAGAEVDLAGRPEMGPLGQSHINIPPNMLRDLVTLGVARECVRSGFPYLGVAYVDMKGREQFRRPTPHMAGPSCPAAIATTHSALTGVLNDAARLAGVNLNISTWCEGIQERGHEALARFSDGSVRAYDIIVAATGVGSPLLESYFGTSWSPEPVGQLWWQVLLRRPRGLDRPTFMAGMAGSFRAGAIPVNDERASLILIQPTADACVVPTAALVDVMRDRLEPCGGIFAEMRGQLSGGNSVLVRPVLAGLLPGQWYSGPVLRIGNAAYAIAPHLGQAAAQCIEDAVAFGALLHNSATPEQLFKAFMSHRYERCRITHDCTLQIAHWELRPDVDTNIPAAARRQAEAVAAPLFSDDSSMMAQDVAVAGRQPSQRQP